jgi:hypothetical protein
VDGRLFRKLWALEIEGAHTEWLVGATVVTQTVHTVHDMALAERFLSHVRAVEEAAYTGATKRLEDFVRAGQRFPEQMQSARSAGAGPRIKTERFEMTPDKSVSVPFQMLNPYAVLTQPPLKLGPGGYLPRSRERVTMDQKRCSRGIPNWLPVMAMHPRPREIVNHLAGGAGPQGPRPGTLFCAGLGREPTAAQPARRARGSKSAPGGHDCGTLRRHM